MKAEDLARRMAALSSLSFTDARIAILPYASALLAAREALEVAIGGFSFGTDDHRLMLATLAQLDKVIGGE